MTTSVEATVQFRLTDALAANPAGLILVLVAIYLLVRRPNSVPAPALWMSTAVLGLMWVFELQRFGFF
jgi:hypothetical protein